MKNFVFAVKDDLLHITINLKEGHGRSKSGRSCIVATTGGNLRLFDENGYRREKINLTVSREIPREEQEDLLMSS